MMVTLGDLCFAIAVAKAWMLLSLSHLSLHLPMPRWSNHMPTDAAK